MDLVNAARLEADGYQLAAKTPDNRKLGYAIECAAKIVMAMNTMDFNKVTSVSTLLPTSANLRSLFDGCLKVVL
jgi:hypothetical protein